MRLGKAIHYIVRRVQQPTPTATYTRFFRNFAQLQVIADQIAREGPRTVKVACLGCSTGVELYSLLWAIKERCPEIAIEAIGVDINESSIEKARKGEYSRAGKEFERPVPPATESLFECDRTTVRVAAEFTNSTRWLVGNACDPRVLAGIAGFDVVLANNFLVHMLDLEVTNCLKRIAEGVAPGGLLCAWGIQLDVREEVVRSLGLNPIVDRIEEIYESDDRALEVWPCRYWGTEPLDKSLPEWQLRYATLFRVPPRRPRDGP